ncbi:hypothetical protein [Halogeometricum sp. CBA1124]|uniref:hypothetical protein n=1 Tax=Halogeometricum sp. CBA1124 TaxID=2668071 RepID=UPI001E3CA0E2|nr:hypothetical protein [Halogeometricum sp. CBA1124]
MGWGATAGRRRRTRGRRSRGRALLYPRTPAAVAYTQTPAEVPAILAGSVASFLALVAVGYGVRVAVHGGWSAIGRVRSVRGVVFAGRTDR